jgi:general secretion pathway protein D
MSKYSAQTGSVTVAVSPPSINASVNQSFNIDIDISNVLDLYGWEFKLSWNASLLNAVSVNEDPFLNSSGNTFFTYYLNTTDEHLVVDCTLLGQVPGVSGNGTLATITFYTVNVGQTPLHLYDVTLYNSAEEMINCTSQDGYGTFNSQSDPYVGGERTPYLT